MSTDVIIHNEPDFHEGMARVRSDQDDANWILCGHWDNNPNEIAFMDCGNGGPEEFSEHMDDTQNLYGLLRLEEEFDMTTAVRFVYIHWDGKDISFVKRGKFGVVQGAIEQLFSPYHLNLNVDTKDELTREYIMLKLQENSGTKSKVLDVGESKNRPERGFMSGTTTKADSTGTTPTKAAKMTQIGKLGSSFTGMSKGSTGLSVDASIKETLADVQADGTETNWCAVGYEGGNPKNPLELLGAGREGTVEDIKQFASEDNAIYGYFRVTDVVDDIPTVKFAYIKWVGENVKPMTKAKLSTNKGALEDLFNPAHVTIYATLPSELTQRIVLDKVMSASGSKSHVK